MIIGGVRLLSRKLFTKVKNALNLQSEFLKQITLWGVIFVATFSTAHGSTTIPNDVINWAFTPSGDDRKVYLSISSPLEKQLPANIKCCEGMYEISLQTGSLEDFLGVPWKENIYLRLPIIFGLRSVTMGEKLALQTESDYSSAGPLLRVSEEDYKNKKLIISVSMSSPKNFVPGPWMEQLSIGTADEMYTARENALVYQKYIPLFISIALLIVALVLAWSKVVNTDRNPIFTLYAQCLVSWAAFYFLLSGIPRTAFPEVASYLHLIIRSIAGFTLVRLVLFIVEVTDKNFKNITSALVLLTLLSAASSLKFGMIPQLILYFFVTALFQVAAGLLIRWSVVTKKKEPLNLVLIGATLVFSIGSAIDSIKIAGYYFFDHQFQYPFLNRFTGPPLILTSLFYLVTDASKRYSAELRSNAMRETREQVLHDLRPPVTAIRSILHALKDEKIDPIKFEILESGALRISEMCKSLEIDPEEKEAKAEIIDLATAIREVLNQTEFSFDGKSITFARENTEPFLCKINRSKFQRVIENLIVNSIEASQGTPSIHIELKTNKKFFTISVFDKGCGLSKDQLKSIGKKYYTHGKATGTGIGLHFVHSTVHAAGGSIIFESSVRGTTVSLSLKRDT